MVVLDKVTKKFDEFTLNNINIEIKEGEFFTLLGGSGCGKSTLLKIISGIIKKYDGSVTIDRADAKGSNPVELGLSMVFQDSLLLPNLNVEDNVAFGLKMKGIGRKERLEKAKEALKELRLEGFEKRHPNDLSGGQKQRVAIARALVMEPKLLLMDEPFSALDEELRGRLQKLLKNIQKKYNSTILFVTHDRDEAFYLSDKLAIMDNGNIVQIGEPKEIYENPANRYVANFLGINNIITGKIEDGYLVSKDIKVKIDRDVKTLALKAEDLRVSSRKEMKEGKDYFLGEVEDYTFKSGFYHINIKCGDTGIEVVQNRLEVEVEEGMKVAVLYKPKNNIYMEGE